MRHLLQPRKRPVDVTHCVPLEGWHDVGVQVGSDADLTVAENLLNHAKLDALRKQERGTGVSSVMKALRGQIEALQVGAEVAEEGAGGRVVGAGAEVLEAGLSRRPSPR